MSMPTLTPMQMRATGPKVSTILAIISGATALLFIILFNVSPPDTSAAAPTASAPSSTYEPEPYDPPSSTVKHVEDFTEDQDDTFLAELEDSLPSLTATVPRSTLAQAGRSGAFALSAGVSEEMLISTFLDKMTGYDEADAHAWLEAVQYAYEV